MHRSPVWTAFITEHVVTRGWARRIDAKTVVLRELERTIFTLSEYTPPRTRRGEHILKFANANGKTPHFSDSYLTIFILSRSSCHSYSYSDSLSLSLTLISDMLLTKSDAQEFKGVIEDLGGL